MKAPFLCFQLNTVYLKSIFLHAVVGSINDYILYMILWFQPLGCPSSLEVTAIICNTFLQSIK